MLKIPKILASFVWQTEIFEAYYLHVRKKSELQLFRKKTYQTIIYSKQDMEKIDTTGNEQTRVLKLLNVFFETIATLL